MGVDVSEQRKQPEAEANKPTRKGSDQRQDALVAPTKTASRIAQFRQELSTGIRELQWRDDVLFGAIAGVLMSLSFLQGSTLSVVAGIVPVGTGLLLGRRLKTYYALNGFATGLVGALVGIIVLAVLIFLTPLGPTMQAGLGANAAQFDRFDVWAQLAGFTSFSLIAFCTFGTGMAGRTEERNRQVRKEVDSRGGQLQKANAIRDPDDIRGLSLPQLGWYVNNLFKKRGFTFKDYRFIDKDKHLDLWMEHEDEIWHLRMSVADKVGTGTIESLLQDMKREGCKKGIVITSTEFMPTALKTAKNRPLVLIDGPTLYQMAESK